MFAVRLSGAQVHCRTPAAMGRRSRAGANFALAPPGTPNWSTAATAIRFATIYLPKPLLDRAAADLGGGPVAGRLRDDLWFVEDAELEALTLSYVARAASTTQPATRLELEARVTLLVERLLTRHHGVGRAEPVRGGLTPLQQARVTEFIRAHSGADVSTAALAALVGLSSSHFTRAFKISAGLPPHAWAMRERLRRGADLLAATTETIAAIASICGFASQQHFTTAFRRHTGMTPAAWRREQRL